MRRRDVSDREFAKARRDVDALHRLATLQIGLARPAETKLLPQRVTGLVDRWSVRPSDRPWGTLLGFLQAPKLPLSLRPRQPVILAGAPQGPDLAVELAPVEAAPAAIVGARLLVEMAGSICALGHGDPLYAAPRPTQSRARREPIARRHRGARRLSAR